MKPRSLTSVSQFTIIVNYTGRRICLKLSCLLDLLHHQNYATTQLLCLFLQGNISLEKSARQRPFDWLPEQGWEDTMKLTTELSAVFGSLADDIERNESSWKEVRTCTTCRVLLGIVYSQMSHHMEGSTCTCTCMYYQVLHVHIYICIMAYRNIKGAWRTVYSRESGSITDCRAFTK